MYVNFQLSSLAQSNLRSAWQFDPTDVQFDDLRSPDFDCQGTTSGAAWCGVVRGWSMDRADDCLLIDAATLMTHQMSQVTLLVSIKMMGQATPEICRV
ncbi:hypothetical protein PoB_000087000 [Plakobranchus ocellatus]|uniref:Uncharacterized protein n=1 Tax=Plakobranchus ocellatus TaxID=259542 RepID=A0AAV3XVE0_9GAST|nr:hypothetical protein PoB_000087000 [Plakobranchus ocellatus]